MQTLANRTARKIPPTRAARSGSPGRRALLPVLLAAALALTALVGAVPARATTGGASAVSGIGAAPSEGAGIAFGPFRVGGASWYGPGLYGRHTACGETLRATTIGVAHRNIPCGTPVKFVYRGRVLVAPVIDRGPYVKGRAWDLTAAASRVLGFVGVGRLRYAVALQYVRPGELP